MKRVTSSLSAVSFTFMDAATLVYQGLYMCIETTSRRSRCAADEKKRRKRMCVGGVALTLS